MENTLTLGNGGEITDHSGITQYHGIVVYFADLYKSWQRWTKENINGRERRVWSKGFNMVKLSEKEIDVHIFLLNITPIKNLNGLIPLEVLTGKDVALIT